MGSTALITGVTGQDGSYLAEFLLAKGCRVVGLVRRSSAPNHWRIRHLLSRIELRQADLLDTVSLVDAISAVRPDEIYNLAAQSFVPASWDQPLLTAEVTALGVTRLLEAARLVNPAIKFYQASSSEMFGQVRESPQNEDSAFHPRSPYGVAKTYGHFATVNQREAHGVFACSGILFNHESPRRGEEFVTRKISLAAARIQLGLQRKLRLGNLEAKRDWGFAGDYVKAMWLMLQQERPSDYVVGTGVSRSVRDFVEAAFRCAGLDWREHVEVDPALFRRAEVDHLVADAGRARRELGWRPEVDFEGLVQMMVEADLAHVREGGPR